MFDERAAQLRVLIEQAREAEATAFGAVKGMQAEMLQCITTGDAAKLDLLENRYMDVEDHWRHCSLYTAELRAEMQDLIKERNGELPPGASNAEAHGATARVSVSSSRGLVHSPAKSKPASIAASEVSPMRRPLVVAAFPDVHPRYAADPKLPIGDSQIRVEFDRLRRSCNTDAEDSVPLGVVVDFFAKQDSIGAPINPEKWVAGSLAKFNPARRRRRGAEHDEAVTFDEFAFLLVRWAQN